MDRAKNGIKRHLITDAAGLPLLVQTTPANVRDEVPAVAMVRALPWRPRVLIGDRGYGFPWIIAAMRGMGGLSQLAVRGSGHGSGLGARRYVVERTLSWLAQHRRLTLCYEKSGPPLQAFHELAASLLCFKRLRQVTAGL